MRGPTETRMVGGRELPFEGSGTAVRPLSNHRGRPADTGGVGAPRRLDTDCTLPVYIWGYFCRGSGIGSPALSRVAEFPQRAGLPIPSTALKLRQLGLQVQHVSSRAAAWLSVTTVSSRGTRRASAISRSVLARPRMLWMWQHVVGHAPRRRRSRPRPASGR